MDMRMPPAKQKEPTGLSYNGFTPHIKGGKTSNPWGFMSSNCLSDIWKTFREYVIALGVVEFCRYIISSKIDHLATDAAVLVGLQLGTPWSHGEWCRLIVPISAGLLSIVPDAIQLFQGGNTGTFFRSLLLKVIYVGLGAGISFFYHKFKRTSRKFG